MDINDIRKIGIRLREELPAQLDELRAGEELGRGAGGDKTHPIDKRAEEIVYEELRRLGEPVTFISEECGVQHIMGGGPGILLDPIDGSRNAISGVPFFSTSIAIIDGDRIQDTSAGYVLNLISGDEYWAVKGGGSFLKGRPIKTQQETAVKVVAYEAQTPRVDLPVIMPLLSLGNRARCFGSTALDLAFLAQGAVSIVVIPSASRSFDFAAGALLIREAGGIVTDLQGGSIDAIAAGVERSSPLLASANEALHARALNVLQTA